VDLLISVLGVLIGIGALFLGGLLEGVSLGVLLSGVSAIIVIGGTLGAVMISTPAHVFFKALFSIKRVFFPPKLNPKSVALILKEMSVKSREEGKATLEVYKNKIGDNFAKKSIQMLCDGVKPKLLEDILVQDLRLEERNHELHADVFKSMGGYSPTIGLAGAILGLINVMQNLNNPELLGHGLAVAFTATLYGVVGANLILLPISEKLYAIADRQALYRMMIITAVVSISRNEGRFETQSKIDSFLDDRLVSGWR
jgi:chemotaxis protein MotA